MQDFAVSWDNPEHRAQIKVPEFGGSVLPGMPGATRLTLVTNGRSRLEKINQQAEQSARLQKGHRYRNPKT